MFNVVKFPIQDGRTYERMGVATGEMYRMFDKMKNTDSASESGASNSSCREYSVSGVISFISFTLSSSPLTICTLYLFIFFFSCSAVCILEKQQWILLTQELWNSFNSHRTWHRSSAFRRVLSSQRRALEIEREPSVRPHLAFLWLQVPRSRLPLQVCFVVPLYIRNASIFFCFHFPLVSRA